MRHCLYDGAHRTFSKIARFNLCFSRNISRSLSSGSERDGSDRSRNLSERIPQFQRKTTPNSQAQDIAILGGGITGLTTAFYISKELPSARITIFEKNETLGGWLQSELIEVDGGHVVFENGPRTLRNDTWGAICTKDLIALLGLAPDLVHISKNSAAARNRYIYYPDHLVRLPGWLPEASTFMNVLRNATSILQEPLFDRLISGILHCIWDLPEYQRPKNIRDESVGAFLTRNFNASITNNIASAGLHGIYAGDINQLSARSILPLVWHLESDRGILGSIVQLNANGLSMVNYNDVALRAFTAKDVSQGQRSQIKSTFSDTSVFTFKGGLGQLAQGLVNYLKHSENVALSPSSDITAVTFDPAIKKLTIEEGEKKSSFDYAVSTLPPLSLAGLLQPDPEVSHRNSEVLVPLTDHKYAVNVMVVNLYYARPNLTPVSGFGYLIPKTVPLDQNPEMCLGVIFGSDSSIGQDTASGTKLTVMFGGHWWDEWNLSDLPDETCGVEMAKAIVQRHLGISEKPFIAKAVLQPQAIPQYTVGHRDRMHEIHKSLIAGYEGRVKVAGNWYHGVGVNDCIKAARRCVHDIREGLDQNTGLEMFGASEKWVLWDRQKDMVSAQTE